MKLLDLLESISKIDEIMNLLKTDPQFRQFLRRTRVFGSIGRGDPNPKDVDIMVDFRDSKEMHPKRIPGINAFLRLAQKYYGWVDPFVKVGRTLYTRNETATDWTYARNAADIWKNSQHEGQRLDTLRGSRPILENPAFRAWFKDSKVVDREGNPLIVYHGTPNQMFDRFDLSKKGYSSYFGIPVEVQRHGFYFRENEAFAKSFVGQPRHRGQGGVIAAYLSIQNPLVITYEGGIYRKHVDRLVAQGIDRNWLENHIGNPMQTWEEFDDENGKVFTDAIKAAGFDGVMFEENNPETDATETTWIAFYPNQIKRVQSGFNPQRDVIHEATDDDSWDVDRFWYYPPENRLVMVDPDDPHHIGAVLLHPEQYGIKPGSPFDAYRKRLNTKNHMERVAVLHALHDDEKMDDYMFSLGWVRGGVRNYGKEAFVNCQKLDRAWRATRAIMQKYPQIQSVHPEVGELGWRSEVLLGDRLEFFLKTGRIPSGMIHESWDNYQEIGHYRGAKIWYLLRGGKLIVDDVGYMMHGATPEDFETARQERDGLENHNPDVEEKTLAVGRVDDLRKKISIRTPLAPGNSYFDLPERTIEFAAKKLRQRYPDYEIWYFGKGASEIRQIMEDTHYFDIGHTRGRLMFYMMPGGKIVTRKDTHLTRCHNEEYAKEAKCLALGRIDPETKTISIRDPHDDVQIRPRQLDYIQKALRREYPDYRMWFFGDRDRGRLLEDQNPVQDRYYWEDENTAQFRVGPYDFEVRFMQPPMDTENEYFRVWRVIGKRPQGGTGLFPRINAMLKKITLEFIQRVKPDVLEINGEDAKRNEFNAKNYAQWTPPGYRFAVRLAKHDYERAQARSQGVVGVAFVREQA